MTPSSPITGDARNRASGGLSRRAAACITALVFALCTTGAIELTDRPLLARPRQSGGASRAAFAIRDFVSPFEQWGTRAFSMPTLESAYDEVEYLTLTARRQDRSDELAQRLARLLRTHDCVDLFLLAHTNPFVDWVGKVPHELRSRLRLVYDCGCFDLRQRERWLALGARSYVGHPGVSASSAFYVFFLRRWVRGMALAEDVDESNELTSAFLSGVASPWFEGSGVSIAGTRAELAGDGCLTIEGSLP